MQYRTTFEVYLSNLGRHLPNERADYPSKPSRKEVEKARRGFVRLIAEKQKTDPENVHVAEIVTFAQDYAEKQEGAGEIETQGDAES